MVDFRGGESLSGNQSEFCKIDDDQNSFGFEFCCSNCLIAKTCGKLMVARHATSTELQMMRENVGRENNSLIN